METINIPVEALERMADMLRAGSASPSAAAFACGAVHMAIKFALKEGEMQNETVRNEH